MSPRPVPIRQYVPLNPNVAALRLKLFLALLYIHRSFFAQAMLDHPANPLRSPFAPSFLAAYRCASGVIKSSLNHYARFPELSARWWGVWTHREPQSLISNY